MGYCGFKNIILTSLTDGGAGIGSDMPSANLPLDGYQRHQDILARIPGNSRLISTMGHTLSHAKLPYLTYQRSPTIGIGVLKLYKTRVSFGLPRWSPHYSIAPLSPLVSNFTTMSSGSEACQLLSRIPLPLTCCSSYSLVSSLHPGGKDLQMKSLPSLRQLVTTSKRRSVPSALLQIVLMRLFRPMLRPRTLLVGYSGTRLLGGGQVPSGT